MFIHHINPVIFSVGSVNFYWYGFMYFLSIKYIIWKIKKIFLQKKIFFLKKNEINILFYYFFIGSFLGGRIGYILLYNFMYYYQHILSILKIWEGGMSFHGGLIGGILGIIFFSKKYEKNFFKISDFILPFIPIIISFGRIGNFINSELWGKISVHSPLSMIFPNSILHDLHFISKHPQWIFLLQHYNALPRHPSQLYECFFEGILIYFILKLLKNKNTGLLSSIFLISYGFFRTLLEMFREPDVQIGVFFNILSLGQILSIPMIYFGIFLFILSYYKKLE